MIDPTGFLLTSIRDNPAVAAISTRIRVGGRGPGDSAWVIDPTTGAKRYKNRWALLRRMPGARLARNAVQTLNYVVFAYGIDAQDASAFYCAISDAAHNLEPRVNSAGIAIWNSRVVADNGSGKDPDTLQPYEEGLIEVLAPTQVVTI
jgi:hypothetical protein